MLIRNTLCSLSYIDVPEQTYIEGEGFYKNNSGRINPMSTEKSTLMHGHPILSGLSPERAKKGKLVTAEEAVRVIRDGDSVATGGFVGTGFPEEIAIELEQYF